MYGKSMDQAEALKEKVADYNTSLEQAMEQGHESGSAKESSKDAAGSAEVVRRRIAEERF